MLVSGFAITEPFHKILPFYIFGTNTIDYDMHMNITRAIVSIGVGTDQCLMSGKILRGKIHSHALSLFCGKSVFLFVPWVEAENIMVRFDFALFLIFIELLISLVARLCKSFGFTQDTVYVVFFSQLRSAVLIKYRFLCKLVMLIYKIIERITITCILLAMCFKIAIRLVTLHIIEVFT